MTTLKKIMISRYDETIKQPPYLTIPIDSTEVYQLDEDPRGEAFADSLRQVCWEKDYRLKFYTISKDPNFDYEAVVYPENQTYLF